MIYVWNGFAIIGRDLALLDNIVPMIEETINDLVAQKGSYPLLVFTPSPTAPLCEYHNMFTLYF